MRGRRRRETAGRAKNDTLRPVRTDGLSAEETVALRAAQLTILDAFVRLCEEHGLRYYLAYGTLLGAVRHKGFIPWDDDIDVTMPRRDYDRLEALSARGGLPDGLSWDTMRTNPHFPLPFGKLGLLGTQLTEAAHRGSQYRQLVSIDVFVLDAEPRFRLLAWAQAVLIAVLRVRLTASYPRVWQKRLLAQAARLLPRACAVRLLDKALRLGEARPSTRVFCAGGPYGHRRQTFAATWFALGQTVEFEGMSLVGPANADPYLRCLYGDYWELPPEHKRKSAHNFVHSKLE